MPICLQKPSCQQNPLLAGANNRNVIITHQFLAAPVQSNRDFLWETDWTFQLEVLSFIYVRVTRDFALWERHLTVYHDIKNFG